MPSANLRLITYHLLVVVDVCVYFDAVLRRSGNLIRDASPINFDPCGSIFSLLEPTIFCETGLHLSPENTIPG